MKNKFISLKTLIFCLLLPILCVQYIQGAVTDSQVANWKDNKTAAFLLMFDDGLNSAYQVAIPELLKRKMIATLYVNPGGNKWPNPAVESPNQWENLIPKTGMVYGDHTWTHNGAADLATEDSEIRLCQEKIMSIFYPDGKPHLISYGQPGVTTWFSYGAELTAILAKYNLISRPTFDGHGTVYALQTIKQMLALADKAIASKGMEYLITHGVERRVSEGDPNWGFQDFWALNKDTLRGVLDGLATRRDNGDLWITDHISQYKYQMERDNKPTFQVLKFDNNEIQLTMTGTLDPNLYDLPLTVITQVPASWVSAYITQGTKTYSVPVVHGLATYDAYPNGETITVKINTDPTAPIGTASSVYLVQPGGSSAVWNGTVTGTLVDLSVQGKSLNEWYKSTTFNIGDEIWLIKGTYTLTDSLVTKATETMRGGFSGIEQTIGARTKGTNPWDFTNESIIDGNTLVRGIVSTTGATIDGLSIQNCAYPSTSVGGNAAAVKITSSSILQNCIVRNNTITGAAIAGGLYSGGVYLTTGGKLLNSYVHHNSCANASGGGNGGGVTIYQLATVDGCTISNNTAYNSGGGVNIIAKTGGAHVKNCIISNNTTTNGSGGGVNAGGGAAFTTGLSLTISNCTISSNTAKTNGGGLFMDVTNGGWEGNPINVTKCIISSNTATGTTGSTGNGGGLYLSRGIFNVSGCTINSNISKAPTNWDNNGGGGICTTYSNGSTLNLTNSILKGNVIGTGKNVGSAINTDMATTFVRNCLITGNTGANFHTQGAGRQCTYQNCTIAGNVNSTGGEVGLNLGWQVSTISVFTNCLFYKSSVNPLSGTINAGKDPKVTYCGFDVAVPSTYADKTGCITGLTSVAFTDAANGDWSLSPTSVAINAGITIAAVTTDISGTTLRPQGTAYDMGAYEANPGTTGIENIKLQFVCFTENHSIKLQGLSNGAQLKVYNMTGTLLVNETAKSSNVSIPLASGFYMVTGVDAGINFTQKVIVR